MKWIYAVASVALFAASALAYEVEEEGDARLGYISVGNNGATSLTFNATSIQNAVILVLFLLVLGALLLPFFGVDMTEEVVDDGYGYSYDQSGYASSGYDEPASGYQGYAKRSLHMLSPVLDALNAGQQKYEDDE